MKPKSFWMSALSLFVALLLALPLQVAAQGGGDDPQQKKLQKEELAQLVAPIALYPDELVVQILMASTYPLEIVQADRWVRQHKELKGDALAKALEKESWDPSVKSLVNFPSVLSAMSEKLDVTSKLGDAFLAQQKDVMDTIQALRKKASDAGNLKTTKEQKVVVEKETIVIQPASPEVVYVPTYSPTVVYGAWAYPAYPPYYYYPPPPPAYPPYYFAAGVAVGVAWGYAWGHSDWHGGDVTINHNQNINVNRNIDRSKYQGDFDRHQGGGGNTWQHDPSHRKGVAYKDKATAQKFGQSPARSAEGRRDAHGLGDGRGADLGGRGDKGGQDRGGRGTADRGASDRGRAGASGGADRGTARGGRDSAFGGGFGNGNAERMSSERGSASRASAAGTGARSGGGSFGGGARSGGGFGGGGGRRR
ncbi:DUF3300 domain-containing protein [Geotalea uraniireducens]|uniref:DUF3300 domain-containing protein n=1 Tax=Geotalea uraniireducens (strain Rf4) TaxID=351605 RepID=A5G4X3_GEOUR|nr:DUF3300 domain-containing protein [Geotalea uraniireducens]ABQ26841.1 hypothetical protein Gura_2667 [Geotalea uraniireducens Rf4]